MPDRKDWAGPRWGPIIDGLLAMFCVIAVACWIVSGGNR